MKNKNIIFSLLLIILLTFVGAFVVFKKPNNISLRENRVLTKFKEPTINSIVDASFQNNFEEAFTDQFIGKTTLFDTYTHLNNVLRKASNLLIKYDSSSDMSLISISDSGVFSIGIDGDWLTEFPWLWSEDYDVLINRRIYNYNELINNNPDVDFYIYKVTNCRDTDWFDKANDIISFGNHYEELFTSELDSSCAYRSSNYLSFDDYKKYNYKTDHHWNADGAKSGYEDIINMINDKYPQIGEAKEPIDKKTSSIKFYGSMAKSSNYNVNEDNYDLLSDYYYDLGNYQLYIDGERVNSYGKAEAYFNNTADDDREINHYRELFGPDVYEKIYDFGNNTGVNLLIIADSYSNCIEPELASHFDKTLIYDLRHKPDDSFNLKNIINKNDIDVVLYLGSFFDIFMDGSYITEE